MRLVAVVAVPHVSGLAIGASAPPVNLRIASLNGCSGLSVNVAGSRPVVSLGVTEPCRRTSTPYRFDSALRYIMYGGAVIGPPPSGAPRERLPFSDLARSVGASREGRSA